jgi:hypothetical protein
MQPLFTIRSMSSASSVMSIVAWLTQWTFSGISARNSSFAAARSAMMLSSTKKIIFGFASSISRTRSATGRVYVVFPK